MASWCDSRLEGSAAAARIVRARASSALEPGAVTGNASAVSAVSYRGTLSFGTPMVKRAAPERAAFAPEFDPVADVVEADHLLLGVVPPPDDAEVPRTASS